MASSSRSRWAMAFHSWAATPIRMRATVVAARSATRAAPSSLLRFVSPQDFAHIVASLFVRGNALMPLHGLRPRVVGGEGALHVAAVERQERTEVARAAVQVGGRVQGIAHPE